jgi:hypothetical protein
VSSHKTFSLLVIVYDTQPKQLDSFSGVVYELAMLTKLRGYWRDYCFLCRISNIIPLAPFHAVISGAQIFIEIFFLRIFFIIFALPADY